MKHAVPLAIVLALATTPAFAQANFLKKDLEKKICDLEAEWTASSVSGDLNVPRRLLAEDYYGVFPDGSVMTKSQALEAFASGGSPFVSNHLETCHVRNFGNVAIAQGSESWVMHPESRRGHGNEGQYIWLDVWVQRNGKWQIVNSEDQDQSEH
jgi:uncharacterized protein DUF4440